MDSDLWISRLVAAKRHYALQRGQHYNSSAHNDRFGYDDVEPEDEIRPDFPCPYCYEDHDITSLCAHLDDEHPFESKVASCPVCSVKVTGDMLDHITLQHGHLLKLQRRHRLHRVAIPSNRALSLVGRDLQETYLKVLLGNSSHRSSSTNASNSVTDSLLSSLVLNLPTSEAEDATKSSISTVANNWFKRVPLSKTWKISSDSNLSLEERERRHRRAGVRASFVQHLLVSTLFDD